MTPAEIASDVAARIEQADEESADAVAAFAAGRFPEYWLKRAEEIKKRIEDNGEHAIANAGSGGTGG